MAEQGKRWALPRVERLSIEEVRDFLESLQLVTYCDADSQGSTGSVNPDREINGAEYVDAVTSLLKFYDLNPIEVKS